MSCKKAMSNIGGYSSRVSIPNSVRKTILDIREITGNHSEEDIYAMLKECAMDPNETTQRLLHLDTFHEVKRKHHRRKENVKSGPVDESRGKPGYQGRGTRGARGNSCSHYISNDVRGRSATIRKDNGAEESREKGFKKSSASVAKGVDSIQPLHVEKSSYVTMNGPVNVLNGTIGFGLGDSCFLKESIDANVNSSSRTVCNTDIKQMPSASDAVIFSQDSEIATAVGTIKNAVQIHEISGDHGPPIPDKKGMGNTGSMTNSFLIQHEPQNVDGLETSSSVRKKALEQNFAEPKILDECSTAENLSTLDNNSTIKLSFSRGMEEAASKLEKLKFPDEQHVIIPDHIQVPDAVKNVLSFGSLNASFGVRENHVNCESNDKSEPTTDLVNEDTACEPRPCDQDVVSSAPEERNVDYLQSHSHVSGEDSSLDPKAITPKNGTQKEEIFPAAGPPFPVIQTTPNYSFGFMPPMLVNPLIQPESFDSQAPVSSSLSGSSPLISTSASTPPAQAAGTQYSVAMPPQPIALLRQPFPPNCIPYNHYYSPFLLPPTMQQYFGHTAFPPLPTGNIYLTPPAAGMKISSAPYKGAANVGNQVLAGMPSIYGAYNSSQVAIAPNVVATPGNSCSSEDLLLSALKENNVQQVQQSEAPAVWLPTAGRDTGSFPLNSFMNLLPQGQPVISPQPALGAFAVCPTMQPMATPAPPGLAPLQPTQPMVGSTESGGPPSNAYQQPPQHQQQPMNWNV